MVNVLVQAGWPGLILLALSVAALALVIERAWRLRRSAVFPAGVLEQALALRSAARYATTGRNSPDFEQAIRALGASPAGALLASALESQVEPREARQAALELSGRRIVRDLERGLPLLATLGTLAPLVGLLGTVAGMIQAFRVQTSLQSDPLGLAAAIGMALNTTALGLGIAIPTILAHRLLREQCENLISELENIGQSFLDATMHRSDSERSSSDSAPGVSNPGSADPAHASWLRANPVAGSKHLLP